MKYKRLKMFVLASFFGGGCAFASGDTFVVNDVEIPQGGSAVLEIGMNNPSYENDCYGFQFMVNLPEGVTASNLTGSSRIPSDYTISMAQKDGGYQVLVYNISETVISGASGTIATITLTAGDGLNKGDVKSASVSTCKMTTGAGVSQLFNEKIDFNITIGEPADTRTVLDENSITAPTAATGVDVRVLRTINADEWGTICLPFAMTEAQVTEAFGDDVQLGDFNDYTYDEDADAITVNFVTATAIEANHPYIIKVSEPVSEFTVDGVDVDPQEAIVDFDTSRRKNEPRQFVGTYVAGTVLDWGTLFISGGNFWYSTGLTKMKAFRAYFNFIDLLVSFEDNSRITLNLLDAPTGIAEVAGSQSASGQYYDLQGRHVAQPAHGLYIKDGKKTFVK